MSDFIRDPWAIRERRARGVKYVVIGESHTGFTELTADSESEARQLARTWVDVFIGKASCFCVQNGEIGGRPFDSFSRFC